MKTSHSTNADGRRIRAVILAAGLGTRMEHLTQENQKGLVSVGTEPFLNASLREFYHAGVREIILVVGWKKEMVMQYYGSFFPVDGECGVHIRYAYQEERLGTAHALWQARDAFLIDGTLTDEYFMMANSDNLYHRDDIRALYEDPMGRNRMIGYDGEGLVYRDDRVKRFAVIQIRRDADVAFGYLEDIVEHPTDEDRERFGIEGRSYVSMNVWGFLADQVFPAIEYTMEQLGPSSRGEHELPDSVRTLLRRYGQVEILPRTRHVPDLTQPTDVDEVRAYLMEGTTDDGRWTMDDGPRTMDHRS